jgi:hypothetical protein
VLGAVLIGCDFGSTTAKAVVLSPDQELLFTCVRQGEKSREGSSVPRTSPVRFSITPVNQHNQTRIMSGRNFFPVFYLSAFTHPVSGNNFPAMKILTALAVVQAACIFLLLLLLSGEGGRDVAPVEAPVEVSIAAPGASHPLQSSNAQARHDIDEARLRQIIREASQDPDERTAAGIGRMVPHRRRACVGCHPLSGGMPRRPGCCR